MDLGFDPYRGAKIISGPWPGEYVRLRDAMQQQPEPWQDRIIETVADLVRRFDPGGYLLTCPVAGCRWELLVPRMELDPTPLDVDPQDRSMIMYVEGVPRENVELELAEHIDWHATTTETVTP
jgi:hypothetical protein